jgi:hypothetical protein
MNRLVRERPESAGAVDEHTIQQAPIRCNGLTATVCWTTRISDEAGELFNGLTGFARRLFSF